MMISDISLPEVYKESQDFRTFCKWFELALSKIQTDIENISDLYDPVRCPKSLLWMLADTMGFKYDDRLPVSFNRLVLIYFMSMIYNRGSKNGVTLAAETNLAQFMILNKGTRNEILYDRLDDTSIPVNSVSVTPHTSDGYIDVVYVSTRVPVDACIEYVRPLGMFLFQYAGVRFDANTKITVDARLTNSDDIGMSYGPTQVGHYRREDYARIQKSDINSHKRQSVWYRNSSSENATNMDMNPGYRTLYSLQLSNNEEITKSLIDPIFSLGYNPQDISITDSEKFESDEYKWNLRYNKAIDSSFTQISYDLIHHDVETIDIERSSDELNPRPAVNPVMSKLGDSII